MRAICDDIKRNVPEVLAEWERRVREQPWYSLPVDDRAGRLSDVVRALADATLHPRLDERTRQSAVDTAAEHGWHRREQGIPENLILTEYHLLRQALWYYLVHRFGHTPPVSEAIMRIDGAITLATNASMWGYHRQEIQALGKWEAGIERIASCLPFDGGSRTPPDAG